MKEEFTIDIDHEAHRTHVRRSVFWVMLICAALLGVANGASRIEKLFETRTTPTFAMIVIECLKYGAIGVGLSIGIYFVAVRKLIGKTTGNFQVWVEGPFLCIRSGWLTVTDRRVHFANVGDYRTIENPFFRKRGLKSIEFRTSMQAPNRRNIIPAVRNADQARDELARLDSERETLSA